MPIETQSSSCPRLAMFGLAVSSLLLAGVLLPCAVRAAEQPTGQESAPPQHDMVYIPAGRFRAAAVFRMPPLSWTTFVK